jgi:hypothetical protein
MYTYYLRTIFTYDMKYENLEILKMWIHSMPQQSFSISRASASTSWHPCSATQGFPWRKALGQPRGLRSFNPLDKTWKHWASRNWIWHDITAKSNLNGKYDRGDGFWTDLLLHIGGRWILGHPSLLTSLWEHQLICSSFSSAFLFFFFIRTNTRHQSDFRVHQTHETRAARDKQVSSVSSSESGTNS